jgi:hypothetical protein
MKREIVIVSVVSQYNSVFYVQSNLFMFDDIQTIV